MQDIYKKSWHVLLKRSFEESGDRLYAYDVLSNLIHGRNLDLYENRIQNKNKVDVVNEGMRFIHSYINDMEYGQLLNETSDKKLLKLVKNSDKYTQTIAIRFLFEKDRSGGSLLSQLKKE